MESVNREMLYCGAMKYQQNILLRRSLAPTKESIKVRKFKTKEKISELIHKLRYLGEAVGIRYYYFPGEFKLSASMMELFNYEKVFVLADKYVFLNINSTAVKSYLAEFSCPFVYMIHEIVPSIRTNVESLVAIRTSILRIIRDNESIKELDIVKKSLSLIFDNGIPYAKTLLSLSNAKDYATCKKIATTANVKLSDIVEKESLTAKVAEVAKLIETVDPDITLIDKKSTEDYLNTVSTHNIELSKNKNICANIHARLFTDAYRYVNDKRTALAFMIAIRDLEKIKIVSIPKLKRIVNVLRVYYSIKEIGEKTNSKITPKIIRLIEQFN